ncbi:hypothetical protein HanPSC8_Chr10g0429371 [Helianthus annuus]|nr:hypothetical protein HanPSC8_Chr10g0429371 [Helianthus annuus]
MASKTLYYKTKPKANQTINLENYSSSTSSKEKKQSEAPLLPGKVPCFQAI